MMRYVLDLKDETLFERIERRYLLAQNLVNITDYIGGGCLLGFLIIRLLNNMNPPKSAFALIAVRITMIIAIAWGVFFLFRIAMTLFLEYRDIRDGIGEDPEDYIYDLDVGMQIVSDGKRLYLETVMSDEDGTIDEDHPDFLLIDGAMMFCVEDNGLTQDFLRIWCDLNDSGNERLEFQFPLSLYTEESIERLRSFIKEKVAETA